MPRCFQSGRRRCLILRPSDGSALTSAEDLFPKAQMVLSPCHMRREFIELKMRLNSLFVAMFGGTYCSSESITRSFIFAHIPRQKEPRCMRQCVC